MTDHRVMFVVALPLALATAGCLSPLSGPAGACTVTVPPLSGGARTTFAAEGVFQDLSRGLLVDWGAFGSDRDKSEAGIVEFPEGSTLRLAVSEAPKDRLSTYGRLRDAWQVTWWADRPDEPAVPARESLVDAGNGHLLQLGYRAYLWYDDLEKAEHGLRFEWYRTDRPPLLGTPLIWNEPLETGDRIVQTWYEPAWNATGSPEIGERLDLRVAETWRDDGVCHARLTGTTRMDPFYYHETDEDGQETEATDSNLTLVVADDRPLPIRYRWANPMLGASTLEMTAHRAGDGQPLPSFESGIPEATSALERVPADEMWEGSKEAHATGFGRARRAVEATETGGEWFANHSEAVPVDVDHDPDVDGQVVDRWDITWVDPTTRGLALDAVVERRNVLPGGLTGETEVEARAERTWHALPLNRSTWPSFQAMNRISQQMYGEPAEDIYCELDEGDCHFGPADAVVETGTALGTFVFLPQGWIRLDTSLSPAPLPEPVG